MKITNEKLEINEQQQIYWDDVKTLKLINDKLELVLSTGKVIEIDHLRPSTVDSAFRAYQHHCKKHPPQKRRRH
ncbi:MAG: hypothetical protein S4CHLAM45_14550 [Chlamydiales bacterium]|nr:hypothetical protein [Chlamydiales bacterium]MCH9620583.1 hypothetical protein [Chlamydiales bacterium]MCH9623545.1 hypothetical protein [Chlamydiales bacterium]